MLVGSGSGFIELVITFVISLFIIGLPVVAIVLLVMLYKKVKSIEELLKKDR